jgi:hypothetical protein
VTHQSNIDNDIKSYFITFDSDLTAYDIDNGRLTTTVDNNPNGTHILDILAFLFQALIFRPEFGFVTASDNHLFRSITIEEIGGELGSI